MSMTVAEWLSQLSAADRVIAERNMQLLLAASDDLLTYTQSIEAEKTGRMIEETHVSGPFEVGEGTLEATIQSDAPYADTVAALGGRYDWPTRTLNDQRARLTQLQLEAEQALVVALTGKA